jgi:hypothetical protein
MASLPQILEPLQHPGAHPVLPEQHVRVTGGRIGRPPGGHQTSADPISGMTAPGTDLGQAQTLIHVQLDEGRWVRLPSTSGSGVRRGQ